MGQPGMSSQVPGAAAAAGRRLLSDCNVVGSVGKGGSIVILLLIGFVVGACFSWLIFWRRERRQRKIEMEYRNRFRDELRIDLPDVTALVQAAHTPTIKDKEGELPAPDPRLIKAASALTEGPLGLGATASAIKHHDSLRQAMSFKEQQAAAALQRQHDNPIAASTASAAALRSSEGNPFAGEVRSYNVCRNEAWSLNNTPSPRNKSGHNSPDRGFAGQPGLIGTSVYAPAADPASPRFTPRPEAEPAGLAAASVAPAASPFSWPAMERRPSAGNAGAAAAAIAREPSTHSRNDTVVVKGNAALGDAAAAAAAGAAAAAAAASSSDYLAAIGSASAIGMGAGSANASATNPFETPALRSEDSEKAAQKRELLSQVQGEEYGDEDLDPEWASLLADLDARLQAAGRPRLSGKERAVAIRSLIVATASQSADAALNKAMHDVETFRRVQSFKAAA